MAQLNRITVTGAGVLGGQIAWHSAFKGKTVVVHDISANSLDNCRAAHDNYAGIYLADVGASESDIAATRARLTYTTDLSSAVAEADLVIESVPEIPAVKTEVYETMADLLPEHTLVATNSSTLLARDFAAATGRPDKYCALHFANLLWMMNVVEIMAHPTTTGATLTAIAEFSIEIGMVPVAVQKEQNGYVLNTWLVPLLNAAQTLVTNGVATPEDVDRAYMIVNRGCAMGPMGICDVVGMKTAFDILTYWGHENGDRQMLANAELHQDQLHRPGPDGPADRTRVLPLSQPRVSGPGFPRGPRHIGGAADRRTRQIVLATGPSGALQYAGRRSGAGWELSRAGSGSVRP